MRCEVRLLGGLVERAGASRIEVELPDDARVAQLRVAVAEQHPALAPLLGSVKVAVDLEIADPSRMLWPHGEVALLPPVAGGAAGVGPPRVLDDGRRALTGLVSPPVAVETALAAISEPRVGGTATFLGTVRDHAPDLDVPVVRLEYTAYEPMADKVLAELAEAILDEHPSVLGVALLHVIGLLEIGEPTVLIACAAPHRAAAFDACRDALGRVTAEVPVFKREITADGDHRWVGLPASSPTRES